MQKNVRDVVLVKNETQARQRETSGHMRWVLLASVALIISGFAVTFGFSNY